MATTPARPWWIWFASASFLAYFAFLELSIAREAEPIGINAGAGNQVESIVAGTPASEAGIAEGDRILAMNGLPIADANDMSIALGHLPLGTPVQWQIERNGTTLDVTTRPIARRWKPIGSPTNSAFVGFALSVAFGLLLLWRGPPGLATTLGALALLSLGCANLPLYPQSFLYSWRELPDFFEALIWPAAIGSIFSPLLMFAFCCAITARLSRANLALMVPGAVTFASASYLIVLSVYSPARAVTIDPPAWLLISAPLLSPGYYFLGLVPLVRSARAATDLNERRRARTLIAGLATGSLGILAFALMLSLRFYGVAEDASLPLWLWLAVGLFSVMPASFAYAILRQRLLDLRVIVRLGLQYAMARGVIAAAIPLAVLALIFDLVTHSDQTVRSIMVSRGWTYAAAGAVAALISFKREAWMTALDRRFFRERYAAHQILKDVVDAIGQSSSFDTAAEKVVSRIDSALHPVMTAVMTRPRTSTTFTVTARRPATTQIMSLLSGTPITEVVRALGRPVVFGPKGLRDVPAAQLAWLAQSNVEVVVPIATDASRDEAMLVLGPRRSEEPYSSDDLDLLGTIGTSLGLLIGRAPAAEPTVLMDATRPVRIANRYRIERPIGEGGMGLVYAAIDETLERAVAIKVIRDQHLIGNSLARFQREARAAASLSHPHIVTIHDFGVDELGSPYLVMELLEGRSLRAAIKSDGRMPPARALPIMAGLCSAVDAAHARGVIHRDMKPDNVFLVGDTHPKILDYGIAKIDRSSTTFGTPGVIGTLAYMAPEQAGGAEAAPAWDVWALSVIAFEMLTGRHPFNGGLPVIRAIPIKTLLPDVSDGLAGAIDRALSLSPAERPATAAALLSSLTL